jgi:hypothetical protein
MAVSAQPGFIAAVTLEAFMNPWQGKRMIAVVTACMCADGTPDFALNVVEVSHEEYENGVHYDFVEDQLADAGYEEPFVHFDNLEAPAFLHPAVEKYLRIAKEADEAHVVQEKPNATHPL